MMVKEKKVELRNFSMVPICIFAIILSLFGCYVLQLHELCDHHRVDRSLRLMFSHYFIVIAINLITVDIKLFQNPESSHTFVAVLMVAALLMFFIAIFSDSIYYGKGYSFAKKDMLLSAALMLIGGLIILIPRQAMYAYLIGTLVVTIGIFALLAWKKIRGNGVKTV